MCESDHPVSVRHVFYRLTDPHLAEPVDKTEHGYKQVQHRIAEMREGGRLPYSWIADASRMGWHVATYDGPESFIRQTARSYRFDLWGDADAEVEVWVESRSIAGTLRDECERLAVSLYPCAGFASKTFAWEAAQYYSGPVAIVYVGDYDPAGLLIDVALERELRKHTEVDIDFRRVAINEGQIAEYGLPTKPRKVREKRRPEIAETVEAEAMPAPILRSLVREAIEEHLPEGALKYAALMDAEGQHFLRTFGLST